MSAAARKHTLRQELFVFDWSFHLGGMSCEAALAGEGEWRTVQLPHDWSIEYPYTESATGEENGVCTYVVRGVGWYRKQFSVPLISKGKKLFLLFEGAYMDNSVYLNGRLVGTHFCGYTPFELDITDFVEFGGINTIAVRVNNGDQPNSRWYSGSGIYRDVWLKTLEPVHIADSGSQIILDALTEDKASFTVFTTIDNALGREQQIILRTVTYDGGEAIGYGSQGVMLNAGENVVRQTLHIVKPRKWSIEDPYLYSYETSILIEGASVDEYKTVFGARSITFDPKKGCFLNGKHIKIIGGAVHQEGGSVGAAVPKKVWRRRLQKLKESGINGVRTGHNPPDEALLEVCDELGFLVLDEAFDEWALIKQTKGRSNSAVIDRGYGERFVSEFRKDLETFIKRDRNHPCIAIWSAGNEIPEQCEPDGVALIHEMVEIFHRLDPTRLVTLACDNIASEPNCASEEFLNELDIVGYNYVGRWRTRAETYYEEDKLDHPEWMQMGTEHTPIRGTKRGIYDLEFHPENRFHLPYPCQPVESSALMRYTLTHDYVIGDFLWTAIDYLGEARWPDRMGNGAFIDSCGFERDAFYFYKSLFNKSEHTLHLLPHWNMDVPVGKIIPVLCFTSCDTVELFVNGKSYGKKTMIFPRYGNAAENLGTPWQMPRATTTNMWLDWDVAYAPGEMEAVGYSKGVEVARTRVHTVGEPRTIVAEPDDSQLAADGRDISQIKISLVDENGDLCVHAQRDIRVAVTGAGKLLAFDAGQSDSHELFMSEKTTTMGGLALLTVQAGRAKGTIIVEISGDGLRSAKFTLHVK